MYYIVMTDGGRRPPRRNTLRIFESPLLATKNVATGISNNLASPT